MNSAMLITTCMNDLKPEIKALSNRNYRKILFSTKAVKQLVYRFQIIFLKEQVEFMLLLTFLFDSDNRSVQTRCLFYAAKSFPSEDRPLIEIPKGPGKENDHVLVIGPSAQMIGRNALIGLWTNEELKPKINVKTRRCQRHRFLANTKKVLLKDFP